MAYMREGFIIIRASGRELIIDEFDEDGIEIETSEDKTSRRMTTKGKNIYSILNNVPYELTISIKPNSDSINRTESFLKYLKLNRYPTLEFETHETIDSKSVITNYTDGNIMTDLESEEAFSSEVPKFTLKIAGTRENREIR